MSKSDRIIVDADVVSHFITAGEMIILPAIFDEKMYILDKVYNELCKFRSKKTEVENLIRMNLIQELSFPENNDQIKKEYFHLKKIMFLGDGEAACLSVAKHEKYIIASSNLKDVAAYCNRHNIKNLTTMHFLCEALKKNIFNIKRCNDFIYKVRSSGGKLPVSDIKDYKC